MKMLVPTSTTHLLNMYKDPPLGGPLGERRGEREHQSQIRDMGAKGGRVPVISNGTGECNTGEGRVRCGKECRAGRLELSRFDQ